MRRNINYKNYDPAKFKENHPDDPVLINAREQAEELSARLRQTEFEGTPLDQQRDIERRFDDLRSQQWDLEQADNQIELERHKDNYAHEKAAAVYQAAHERVMQAGTPKEQVAAWEGVHQDADHAIEQVANDPDYLKEKEQLTEFQAARSEAISHEIYEVQQQHLEARGLDQVQEPTPEATLQERTPEVTVPEQVPEATPQEVRPDVKTPEQMPEVEPQAPTPEIAQRSAALSAYDKIASYTPPTPSQEQIQEKDAYEHEM